MRASLFGFDVDLRDHIDPIEICGLAPELGVDASRAPCSLAGNGNCQRHVGRAKRFSEQSEVDLRLGHIIVLVLGSVLRALYGNSSSRRTHT